jgi:AcrR family transcriptional regulator
LSSYPLAQPGGSRPRRVAQQARSRETHRRVVDSATRLFLRDGYPATTMAAIANDAGVAVQSLYLRFGSKVAILAAALDVAIAGDDEPIPLLERAWTADIAAARTGRHAVEVCVAEIRRIVERTQPLYAVLLASAAGDAGELLTDNKRQRREGLRAVAELLAGKPGFAADLKLDQAGDLLYTVLSEETYGLLVIDCGWTPDAWQSWNVETITRLLFPTRGHLPRPWAAS